MIIKLAITQIKKLPSQAAPAIEQLEQSNKIVHLSRPENGQKLKQPVRIIDNGV